MRALPGLFVFLCQYSGSIMRTNFERSNQKKMSNNYRKIESKKNWSKINWHDKDKMGIEGKREREISSKHKKKKPRKGEKETRKQEIGRKQERYR